MRAPLGRVAVPSIELLDGRFDGAGKVVGQEASGALARTLAATALCLRR
jgi:hypothetical protein